MAAVALKCGIRLWSCSLRGQPKVFAAAHLKKGLQGIDILAKNHYGKDAALGYLLGVEQGQESPTALGQHPPPVSIHKAEQDMLLTHCPDQPENPKILRVAIIGAPNAGKSTLSNKLLGRKVFPVSKKVHTTRCQAQAVITDGNTQMILLDTPGFTTKSKVKRHNLEKSLLRDPWDSVKAANLVLVLVDMADSWTRHQLHQEVLKCLSSNPELPSVLVMNKVDLVKKKGILLDLVEQLTEGFVNGKRLQVRSAIKPISNSLHKISQPPVEAVHADVVIADSEHKLGLVEGTSRAQKESSADSSADSYIVPADVQEKQKRDVRTGWPHFQEIFMLSAVNGEEVETLKRYLLTLAKPSPWEFHSEVVTTQSPQEICNNIIRSKLLDHLPQEVPYSIIQINEVWEEGPCGELVILQKLLVQKDSHVKMVIGPGGQFISKIAQEAGEELMNIFFCEVHLKLAVKVKK